MISYTALPDAVLQDMRSSQEKAQAAILYHATQGRVLTNKIKDSEVILVDLFLWQIKILQRVIIKWAMLLDRHVP